MPTIYEIAQGIKQVAEGGRGTVPGSPSIVEGLTPKPLGEVGDGIYQLSVSKILSLNVPIMEVENGIIAGYQRDARKTAKHVRDIARAIRAGAPMPTATVAKCEGDYYITDGSHRALAAVMTKTPFRCEIRKLTVEQQRQLFHNQTNAKKLPGNISILTGEGPLAEYVQDVMTAPESAWSGLISLDQSRGGKIGPSALGRLVSGYMLGHSEIEGRTMGEVSSGRRFDRAAADELAGLFRAFGTSATNRLAFEAMSLRAITMAATMILRRPEREPGDLDRWMRHMPKFDFAAHRHLRSARLLRMELVKHWNKRLAAERRVEI